MEQETTELEASGPAAADQEALEWEAVEQDAVEREDVEQAATERKAVEQVAMELWRPGTPRKRRLIQITNQVRSALLRILPRMKQKMTTATGRRRRGKRIR